MVTLHLIFIFKFNFWMDRSEIRGWACRASGNSMGADGLHGHLQREWRMGGNALPSREPAEEIHVPVWARELLCRQKALRALVSVVKGSKRKVIVRPKLQRY